MSATTAFRAPSVRRRRRRRADVRSGLGLAAWASIAVLVVVFLIAAIGPLLTSTDPNAVHLSEAYGAPSPAHPLGQDGSGRDLLARLIHGARTALIGPLLVVTLSTVLGTALALVAAWFGGWADATLSRAFDILFAFPGLLLAILATSVFGTGMSAAVAALSIAYVPYLARIVRAAALRERAMPYVAALQIQGLRRSTICLRHILPNVSGLIFANATTAFGMALIELASLSFIGLGVQPPTADWGGMVSDGIAGITQQYPQQSMYASGLIVLTVAAANLLGDRLAARSEARS